MPLLQKNGHWEKRPYANCMWAIWLFSLDMTLLSLPEHQQTIQVSHLALLQVPFPGQGAAKNARFRVKMDNDGRLPYQPNKPPGKWIMGQNTPQVIGNGAWGTFMPHPGVNPGPNGPKMGVLGLKIGPNERMP